MTIFFFTCFVCFVTDVSTFAESILRHKVAAHTRQYQSKHHHEHHFAGPFFEGPLNTSTGALQVAVHLYTEGVFNCRVGMLKDKTVSSWSNQSTSQCCEHIFFVAYFHWYCCCDGHIHTFFFLVGASCLLTLLTKTVGIINCWNKLNTKSRQVQKSKYGLTQPKTPPKWQKRTEKKYFEFSNDQIFIFHFFIHFVLLWVH